MKQTDIEAINERSRSAKASFSIALSAWEQIIRNRKAHYEAIEILRNEGHDDLALKLADTVGQTDALKVAVNRCVKALNDQVNMVVLANNLPYKYD